MISSLNRKFADYYFGNHFILPVLACFYALALAILLVYAVSGTGSFPAHEDETIFYNAARVFTETGSIQASSIIEEKVALVGSCNWYGPFYNIFYGSFADIFGFRQHLLIYIHFLFLVAAVSLFFLFPVRFPERIFLVLCFLSAEATVGFAFTYYPETFHLFSGVLMTLALIRLDSHYGSENFNRYRIIFMALVFLFTLCRVTSVFWLAALIPYSGNRMSVMVNFLIFIGGVLFAMLFLRFFTAPPYAEGQLAFQYLYSFEWWTFIQKAMDKLATNLFKLTHTARPASILLFFLLSLTLYRGFMERNRLMKAAVLTGAVLISVLMTFYTTHPLMFTRQTAILIPLLVGTGLAGLMNGRAIIIILFLISAPFAFGTALKNILDRKESAVRLADNRELISSFSGIKEYMDPMKKNTVLWVYNEYHELGNAAEAFIPLSTKENLPVLYTTNLNPSDAPADIKFVRHNKLNIDYILSRQPLGEPDLKEVYTTKYFHFYQIHKQKNL
ncbi:MAG: hypothetical protein HYY40_02875 [Bacteroidetes bacterium]|nr:hypothetical protein [Bacteroidota bacterium]